MPRPKSPAKDNASHGERERGKSAGLVNLNLHAKKKKKKRLCFSFVCVAHLSCIARQLRLLRLRLLRHLLLLLPMHGNYLICVCPKKKSVKISAHRRAIKMQTLSAISFTLQARTRCVYATRSCIVVASAMDERMGRLGKVSGIQR